MYAPFGARWTLGANIFCWQLHPNNGARTFFTVHVQGPVDLLRPGNKVAESNTVLALVHIKANPIVLDSEGQNALAQGKRDIGMLTLGMFDAVF